jgi:hypothetical protein
VGTKDLRLARPLRSGETSRPDSRDPVARGVKYEPHGGEKRKPKLTESAPGVFGGSAQNRRVTWLSPKNQDRRLSGRRWDPGAPRSFDAGGHVARSQGLRREDAVCGDGVTVR